jgi:hypothetical protein
VINETMPPLTLVVGPQHQTDVEDRDDDRH